jgi:hypothetical protein
MQGDGATTQNGIRSKSVDEDGRRLSTYGRRVSVVDDVFGEIVEGGPNYRNVRIPLLFSRRN